MKDHKDGSMTFEVTVNNKREFIRWILQYGSAAEILEPKSAREALKKQLSDWVQLYK
jgi:predicted DNA-binding transcriptional regulator YafY